MGVSWGGEGGCFGCGLGRGDFGGGVFEDGGHFGYFSPLGSCWCSCWFLVFCDSACGVVLLWMGKCRIRGGEIYVYKSFILS